MATAGSDRYVRSARLLHWLMAVGFIFMWSCGFAMTSLVADDSQLQEFLFGLHVSIGVTLLLLWLSFQKVCESDLIARKPAL